MIFFFSYIGRPWDYCRLLEPCNQRIVQSMSRSLKLKLLGWSQSSPTMQSLPSSSLPTSTYLLLISNLCGSRHILDSQVWGGRKKNWPHWRAKQKERKSAEEKHALIWWGRGRWGVQIASSLEVPVGFPMFGIGIASLLVFGLCPAVGWPRGE